MHGSWNRAFRTGHKIVRVRMKNGKPTGETRHITFHLDPRTLSQVDATGARAISPGDYKIYLGSSQPDGDAAQSIISKEFKITGMQPIPR